MPGDDILIVGAFGEVGRRVAAELEPAFPGQVVLAGRRPRPVAGSRTVRLDVDRPETIEPALQGVGTVVACVREREPHLLRAAIRRGLAYTSVAPVRLPWDFVEDLRPEARRTGARVVLAAGLEPGISSVLARAGADRLGRVDAVETALLLGAGDAYGTDMLGSLLDELLEEYEVLVGGTMRLTHAFDGSAAVDFPAPIGRRRAYTMPLRDQAYYQATLGARTSIARLAFDPPWISTTLAALARVGAQSWASARAVEAMGERFQREYPDRDRFGLVVEVRGGGRIVRASLTGRGQARATAAGAGAIVKALHRREVSDPGVWLPEEVIEPAPFLARLAARGLVPQVVELRAPGPGVPPSRVDSGTSPGRRSA